MDIVVLNKLTRLLDAAAITLTDHQKQQLVAYVGMLDKWNKAYNLTSVRDPNEMLVRHILDSIVVAPHLEGSRFIDVGTGPACLGSRYPLSALINNSRCLIVSVNAYGSCVRCSMN
ncbi:glucose inhibited division protein [Atlantibacter hermannii]|nr:glucose inhibited division protein [Atlantibacter hermannii]